MTSRKFISFRTDDIPYSTTADWFATSYIHRDAMLQVAKWNYTLRMYIIGLPNLTEPIPLTGDNRLYLCNKWLLKTFCVDIMP
jgi:hypothetical protein